MKPVRKRTPSRRRQGNPDPHPDLTEAVAVSRFWRNVTVGSDTECWPWLGDTSKGYGTFSYHGRMYGAHELALSFTTGEKRLDTLETCHSCDNPICVNPAHLRFDTHVANVGDMRERGRNTNGALRLTDAVVREIRERRANGARQLDLADEYGISDSYTSMLVTGARRPEAGGPIETKQHLKERIVA